MSPHRPYYLSAAAVQHEARAALRMKVGLCAPPVRAPAPETTALTAAVHLVLEEVSKTAAARPLGEQLLTGSLSLAEIVQRVRAVPAFAGATADQLAAAIFAEKPYQAWVAQHVERLRTAGRLVTDRQYLDLLADRSLRVGDRARYVGPTRLEQVGDHQITRPQGQTGTITKAVRRPGSDSERSEHARLVVTFQPDVDPQARAAAFDDAIDLCVVALTVAEGAAGGASGGYFDLERIPT